MRVKKSTEYGFLRRCSSIHSRFMCQFVEIGINRRNLTLGDLLWPDVCPDPEMIKVLSSCFVYSFECCLPHVVAWLRSRVRPRGAWKRPHTPACLIFLSSLDCGRNWIRPPALLRLRFLAVHWFMDWTGLEYWHYLIIFYQRFQNHIAIHNSVETCL